KVAAIQLGFLLVVVDLIAQPIDLLLCLGQVRQELFLIILFFLFDFIQPFAKVLFLGFVGGVGGAQIRHVFGVIGVQLGLLLVGLLDVGGQFRDPILEGVLGSSFDGVPAHVLVQILDHAGGSLIATGEALIMKTGRVSILFRGKTDIGRQ